MKKILPLFMFTVFALVGCGQGSITTKSSESQSFEIVKSDKEWKEVLSDEEYYVLREKGTEPRLINKYNKHKETGMYHCAGCNNPLFSSKTKYDSGSGWPAFYDYEEGSVTFEEDKSFGMVRSEVMCAKCGGHLGHVFDDGPRPTGLRYCINSISLDFKKEE